MYFIYKAEGCETTPEFLELGLYTNFTDIPRSNRFQLPSLDWTGLVFQKLVIEKWRVQSKDQTTHMWRMILLCIPQNRSVVPKGRLCVYKDSDY